MSAENVIFGYLRALPLIELRAWLVEANLSYAELPAQIRAWRDLVPGRESLDLDHRRSFDLIRSVTPELVPALLRVVDPPDEAIAELLSERDCPRGWRELTLTFHFRENEQGSLLLTDLAAASSLFAEMYVAIAAAHYPLGLVIQPPDVRVQSGSIQFTTSGALLPVGVGIVLATAAGLVATPIGYAAGALLTSAGAVDTFLGWRRTIAERRKLGAEELKYAAEARKLDAERAKLTDDARRERVLEALLENEFIDIRNLSSAASANVDRDQVKRLAQYYNVSEAYIHHLVNRTLRSTEAIKKLVPHISHELRDPGDDTLPRRE